MIDFEKPAPNGKQMPGDDFFGAPEETLEIGGERIEVRQAVEIPDGPLPRLEPTAEEPLRGLTHLARVADVGRARIIELSETIVEYVWDPVAAPGWFVLIAGPVAGGKTTLAFLIVAARAHDGDPIVLVGRPMRPAPRGRYVVVIEGEVDSVAAARKLRRSFALLGVDEGALDRVILIARKGLVVGDHAWQDIERLIAVGLVSDIFVDTIARVMPGDANDEAAQVALFDLVARGVERAPTAEQKPIVWLLAHKRKGSGDELDDIGGSVQRAAQIDSILILDVDREPSGRVLSTTVSFKKLRHDPDVHPEPVLLTLTKTSIAAGAVTRDERALEDQILDELENGPSTKNALAKRLGKSGGAMKVAVDTLFAAGRLRGADVPTKSGTYRGIALRDPNRSPTGKPDRGFST